MRVKVFRGARERKRGEGIVLIVDSSGVKVMGKGEWAKRREGKERGRMERKGWIKVHICVDFETGEILEFCLTDERVHDSKVFKGMISRMKRMFGDRVRARSWDGRESEIGVRIWILNKMLEMGDGMRETAGS